MSIYHNAWFTQNSKASHDTAANRICQYLQGTNDNSMVSNPPMIMVIDFYVDAYFVGLWRHYNPCDIVFNKSETIFVLKFSNIMYCGYQIYRYRLLYINYITSMSNGIILLETHFTWKFLSRKWLKTKEWIVRKLGLCQDLL